ncbi:hypothetical protein [Inhella sp.]|uniref:hypothetical protein n=1 Tax=Inhella sp. TaxID=1921806 RepID=UPI0035B09536
MKYDADNDPLWLQRPRTERAIRIGFYLVVLLLFCLLMGPIGVLPWLFLVMTAGKLMERLLSALWREGTRLPMRHRQGKHYAFAGHALDVHDDGRDCWVDETSVRRLLGLQKDPAFKARFPNQWREAHELGLKGQLLWIKVSALHQHLGEAAERMDPKRLKLRAYLDREILQPAARRRERSL